MHIKRLETLRLFMHDRGLDGFILSKPENQFYISGYNGEGITLITDRKAIIITDFRYVEQAREEAPDFETEECPSNKSSFESCKEILSNFKVDSIGVESHHLTVRQYDELVLCLEGTNLVKVDDLVENLRRVKDNTEIELISMAQRITDDTFSHILGFIKPGVSEQELAEEIEHFMKTHGANRTAFDTIVVSGPKGSKPHGTPGKRKFAHGDFITMDFGAKYMGYCSDMTRTVVLGRPNNRQVEIYNLVLKAQCDALEYIKPGLLGKDVDKVARDMIVAGGYGPNFGHGLGHAVGLEIHENPRLSPNGDMRLLPGNVITVEPGIYIEGFCGVRIEDMVMITEGGCVNFTLSPKELICL